MRRGRFVDLICEGKTVVEAARELGADRATGYRWVTRPEIAAEIDRRNSTAIAEARRIFVSSVVTVAARTARIARGEVVADPAEIRAQEAIFDRIGFVKGQVITLDGAVEIKLPDLRGYTPEQLAALAGEAETP